ncbi:hypothetical protein QL996_06435 [Planococcus sp. APC 4015]|nr:hypothetical protein [Planococcus sp. APC 4015]
MGTPRLLAARWAAIALAAVWLLVGGAPALAAGAERSSAAAADAAPTCDEMISPERATDLAASGYVETGNPASTFPSGGVQCWWYVPGAERAQYVAYGFAPVTAEQFASYATGLVGAGTFAAEVGSDGSTVYRSLGRSDVPLSAFVHPSWRVHETDGFAFFVVDADAEARPGSVGTASWADAFAEEVEGLVLASSVEEPVEAAEPESSPVDPARADDDGGDVFGVDTPSVLRGLRTVSETGFGLAALGSCAALALVLTALVGIPGRFIDNALNARFSSWQIFARRSTRPVTRLFAGASRSLRTVPRQVVIGAGLLAASLLAALVDPRFGVNEGSLRLVLTLLAALLIENVAGLALVAGWLARRGARARLELRAGSLLVVLVSALVSRLAGFEPGFVFGLVLSLLVVHGAVAGLTRDRALAETAWLVVLGIGSWLAYSGLVSLGLDGAGFLGLFAVELFGGLTVGALFALVIVLLPLRGQIGGDLWRVAPGLWTVLFAFAAFTTAVILLPLPASWGEVGVPVLTWVLALVGYAVCAAVVWAVLVWTPDPWLTGRERETVGDRVV